MVLSAVRNWQLLMCVKKSGNQINESTVDTLNSYNKKDLRAYYKKLRCSLTDEQARKMDQEIMIQFRKIPIQGKGLKAALIYIPISHTREVDTKQCIQYLREEIKPGLQVAFPKTNFTTSDMDAILPAAATTFTETKHRLTEPDGGQKIAPGAIDVVLLPLLVFDQKGNRVGYGKGFYDRFLAKCRPDVLRIGLSYLPPITQIEDVTEFDIPLDYCATPDRLYDFTNQ